MKASACGIGAAAAHKGLACFEGPSTSGIVQAAETKEDQFYKVEARYYKKIAHEEVECELCPRKCRVGDKERGYCGVRENQDGIYYTLVHSRPCALHADPIEKKPLFHYLPSSIAFSLATAGCNMNCKYCQNWDISQARPEQVRHFHLPPAEVVSNAAQRRCLSIAYTYSEPIVFYEYMIDTARAAKAAGIRNVMISAGYIQRKPLLELCQTMDAIKIDFKAFTEAFYKDICRAELKPVKEALVTIMGAGVWLELVYLVVPTLNDKDDEVRKMCAWIKSELGPDVPVHFTRFQPMYLLENLSATPTPTLERLRKIAMAEGLNWVYIGNVPGHEGENTNCRACGKTMVRRIGFVVLENRMKKGRCGDCGAPIPGVWA